MGIWKKLFDVYCNNKNGKSEGTYPYILMVLEPTLWIYGTLSLTVKDHAILQLNKIYSLYGCQSTLHLFD